MEKTEDLFSSQILFEFEDIPTASEVVIPEVVVDQPTEIISKPNFIKGNAENISNMLPVLMHHQVKNVALAEQRFMQGKGVMFTDGTGTGKAQPLYSKILTPKGWKKMGEIKVGDFVIGANGKKTKVLNTYPQGLKDIFEITFSDQTTVRCCKEHLWETQTLYERRKHSANKNWECGKPKVRSVEEIFNTIDKSHFIPIVQPIEFCEKIYIIPFYTMGFLLGDGYLNKYISVSTADLDALVKIESELPTGFTIQKRSKYDYTICCTSSTNLLGQFESHPWRTELIKLKLLGKKSHQKFVPEKYLIGSIKQRTELLQGLLDSDGTVDKKTFSPIFYSTSLKLAEGVSDIVRSLGGTANIKNKQTRYEYNGQKLDGLPSYCVYINLPKEIEPFFIERKKSIYKPNEKYFPRKKIISVKYVESTEAQCISVEDKRHLYVTDGYTLTHNTFTGLGIAYRFYHQGKKEILIVVPTDQKCLDWIEEGEEHFDLSIYQLQGINDSGYEITVTTYANFYQNEALKKRRLDLILYDESHYLGQNAQGSETTYYDTHKIVANLPSSCRRVAAEIHNKLNPDYDGTSEYYEKRKYYKKIIQLTTERLVLQTKVAFFSATPFAYHKSIKYADGTLFDIEESIEIKEDKYTSYNEPAEWGDFLITNFGYQIKSNKITIPESGVDLNLMERMFFENMKEKGVMSTKVLELEQDYSRDFITVDSDLGEFINKGMEEFYSSAFQKRFPILTKMFSRKYNYMYVNQLLECIKAREVLDRIQDHIDLGRKVVIFHSYNHAAIDHPFRYDAYKMLNAKEDFMTARLLKEIELYQRTYPEYYNLDLSGLKNTRDTILKRFPRMKQFNGTVNKRKRSEFLKDFNDDSGTTNIFLVQQKAGKEGISLHDVTGIYQRVLIQLGLPTEPTGCIQIEGRTYRQGVRSNAPYEYITLQTTFERIAFGEKIALRSRTAENLAMGNLARDLETSFKEGYLSSSYKPPSLEQGVGGKENDRFNGEISDFDKAISYYYSRQKRNSKTKAKEGGDYFATPEPLGMKLVEWAKPQPNESGLEPSAGHGAIARFFPGNTTNHFIEQNINLTGELYINADGVVKISEFETHSPINKYDFIVMNPPFGTSGKLAMDHLRKAMLNHSERYNCRIFAIVPSGPAMGKRVSEFFDDPVHSNQFYIKTMIKLPSCVFSRAGTNVSTNVLEIIRNPFINSRSKRRNIDLTHIETITDFFEEIRDMEL